MDGTVLDLRFDNEFWSRSLPQQYAAKQGIDLEAAIEELLPRFRAAEGRLDWYCVNYWSQELGVDVMALKRQHAAGIALLPGAEDFLQAQQQAGRRLWLVTNAHPETLALKLERTGIDSYFERCVTSHELGYAKEDARFWLSFRDVCHVPAQSCVMIDDNRHVLQAATDHGIGQRVQITRPDTSEAKPREAEEGLLAVPALADLLD